MAIETSCKIFNLQWKNDIINVVAFAIALLFNVYSLEFMKLALSIQFSFIFKIKFKGVDIMSKFKVYMVAFVMVPTNS
jgi:hypothetical protein